MSTWNCIVCGENVRGKTGGTFYGGPDTRVPAERGTCRRERETVAAIVAWLGRESERTGHMTCRPLYTISEATLMRRLAEAIERCDWRAER